MKKHIYRYIGYYNEVGDARKIGGKTADEILDYYKHGYGAFFEDEFYEEGTDLILEDEQKENDDIKVTTDGKFVVVDQFQTWTKWRENYADREDGDDSEGYIDIYELYDEREIEDTAYEVCPYCDEEVEISAELKISRCPNCGKWIVHCSMCFNPELNYSCKDCCLEVLAHKLNEEENEE